MSAAQFVRWEAQAKALNLGLLVISYDGFDPQTRLDTFVDREVRGIMITNGGGRFRDFTLPVDATLGDAAKAIDTEMAASGWEDIPFFELLRATRYNAATGMLFLDAFIGS